MVQTTASAQRLNQILNSHLSGDIETAELLRQQSTTFDPLAEFQELVTEPSFTRLPETFIKENTRVPSYPPPGTYRVSYRTVMTLAGILQQFITDYNLTSGDPDREEEAHQAYLDAENAGLMDYALTTYDPAKTIPQHLLSFRQYQKLLNLYTYQNQLYITEPALPSENLDRWKLATHSQAADQTIWIRSATSMIVGKRQTTPLHRGHPFLDHSIPETWAELHTTSLNEEQAGGPLQLHQAELIHSDTQEQHYGTYTTHEIYMDCLTRELFLRKIWKDDWTGTTEQKWDFGALGTMETSDQPVFFPVNNQPA